MKSRDIYPRMRVGKLTVLARAPYKIGNRDAVFFCACDCGRFTSVKMKNLGRNTNSCGCLRAISNFKHGRKKSTEYNIWNNMKQRCGNAKQQNYKYYGARGISVCDRWTNSFEDFLLDMGPRPPGGYSLDRVDNDGNYEPSNCQWATSVEQRHNQRDRLKVAFSHVALETNGFNSGLLSFGA